MYGSMYASLSGVMQIDCDNLSVYINDCVYVRSCMDRGEG